MSAFEELQKHYYQRDLAARTWKKGGGKVVGYFCDYVPEEFILAAGLFPLRLSGTPEGDTDVARENLIPRFSDREDFVHSMLNQLLTGGYDYLDYLVIPHSRDSIHRLYQLLAMLKTSQPELNLPELFFLDTLHAPFFATGRYERDRMFELKDQLAEWSGRSITSDALSQAITVTNENKKLLKQLAAHRAGASPAVSGTDALKLIGASMVMMKSEHNRLLNTFLNGDIETLPPINGRRVFVSGSPHDHTQIYECIEAAGALVVGEDHCWGNRYSDLPVDTALDPLEAIIDRYHFKSPCARMFPTQRRIDDLLRAVSDSNAEQVIFYVYANDPAEAWEIPEKVKALTKKGIPAVVLKNQPYGIDDPDAFKASIQLT